MSLTPRSEQHSRLLGSQQHLEGPAKMSQSSTSGSGSLERPRDAAALPQVEFPLLFHGRGSGVSCLHGVLGGIGAAQFPLGQWSGIAGLEVVPRVLLDH